MSIHRQVVSGIVAEERRGERTHGVAARSFDLDDVGTQVAGDHRREGSGEDTREVKDSYAFKW
jgi:hypothetical protein